MGLGSVRKLVSYVLMVLFPAYLFAADSNAAMLYTNGRTWVNGASVPRVSSAIFSGDMVQTPSNAVANIDLAGSNITVHADSLVDYEGDSLRIEHGGLTVSTSKGIAATAGDVKVAPANDSWTEFNVIDVDGTVRIAARKGDVTVTDTTGTTTLAQGQETTREEQQDSQDQSSDKKKDRKKGAGQGATPAAGGGWLNSPIGVAIGGAAVIGVATWVLVKSDNPASPSKP